MNIKTLFKTNERREAEALQLQMAGYLEMTAGVPGDTLGQRIANLLPPAPVLQAKIQPPAAPVERIVAA